MRHLGPICQASRAHPRGKPGFWTFESSFRRETDSPLEEAVKSEPVSEWGEFPASWENTGNSSDSGLDDANLSAKRLEGSITYK